jgi:hypothetical protein
MGSFRIASNVADLGLIAGDWHLRDIQVCREVHQFATEAVYTAASSMLRSSLIPSVVRSPPGKI